MTGINDIQATATDAAEDSALLRAYDATLSEMLALADSDLRVLNCDVPSVFVGWQGRFEMLRQLQGELAQLP